MKKLLNRRVVVFALLFAIYHIGSVWALTKYSLSMPIGLGLILVNVIAFVVFIYLYIRSIQFMDEVQIKIQFEAVVIAFALTLILIMKLGLVNLITKLNPEIFSFQNILPALFLFYFIGLFISNRRYS